jgi:hypothetical protein
VLTIGTPGLDSDEASGTGEDMLDCGPGRDAVRAGTPISAGVPSALMTDRDFPVWGLEKSSTDPALAGTIQKSDATMEMTARCIDLTPLLDSQKEITIHLMIFAVLWDNCHDGSNAALTLRDAASAFVGVGG